MRGFTRELVRSFHPITEEQSEQIHAASTRILEGRMWRDDRGPTKMFERVGSKVEDHEKMIKTPKKG